MKRIKVTPEVKDAIETMNADLEMFDTQVFVSDSEDDLVISISLTKKGIVHFGWDMTEHGWDEMGALLISQDEDKWVLDGDFDYPNPNHPMGCGYTDLKYHFTPK